MNSNLIADLQTKALAEAKSQDRAVSALVLAAVSLLGEHTGKEAAVMVIVEGLNSALAQGGSLITVMPAGRA